VVPTERTPSHVGIGIQVADNGIGMDDATTTRVFAPFIQADTSTTRRFGGTGLGLTISRRLAEPMGGGLCKRCEDCMFGNGNRGKGGKCRRAEAAIAYF
jgi:signal transduction histidine kinase